MSSHHDWVDQTVKLHNATKPFAPENGRCLRFAVGDKVIYTNPAGLKFRFSITGHYRPLRACQPLQPICAGCALSGEFKLALVAGDGVATAAG